MYIFESFFAFLSILIICGCIVDVSNNKRCKCKEKDNE